MKKQTASKDAPKPETASALDISPAYLNMVYALENQEKAIDAFGKAATAKAFEIMKRLLGRARLLWLDKRFSHIPSMTGELNQLRNWAVTTPKFPVFLLPGATSAALELVNRRYDSLYALFRIRDEYHAQRKPACIEANPNLQLRAYRLKTEMVEPTRHNLEGLRLEFMNCHQNPEGSLSNTWVLPIQALLVTEAWFAELDAAIELLALANPKGSS